MAVSPKLSVIIPIYNERATIEELLWRVQSVDVDKEMVLVDDNSTDGTRDFLKQLADSVQKQPAVMRLPQTNRDLRTDNVRVFLQERNQGKGAALRRGFKEAQGQLILIQDADLEYDPADYHILLAPLEKGVADVVYGSRFLGGEHRVHMYWHYLGNRFLTMLSNMFTNVNLSDVWTCYKVFRREVLAKITIKEDRFGFEQEITSKIAKGRWRIYEVPISYYGRSYAEGKKITWKDGIRALICVIQYRLSD